MGKGAGRGTSARHDMLPLTVPMPMNVCLCLTHAGARDLYSLTVC
jgi:hypothetical protein